LQGLQVKMVRNVGETMTCHVGGDRHYAGLGIVPETAITRGVLRSDRGCVAGKGRGQKNISLEGLKEPVVRC